MSVPQSQAGRISGSCSQRNRGTFLRRVALTGHPGHLVLPAFPLCIGRILEAGRFIPTRFFLDLPPAKKKPRRGGAFSRNRKGRQAHAVARASRRLALCWKNSAWLITAETFAGWNGFAIRKAGSGRSPVRKRSG